MKRTLYCLIIAGFFMVSTPGICQPISITPHFEHGNIILKERIGDSLLVVETRHSIKRDSIGDQYYWFYFKMDNLPTKSTYLRFENLEGVYRGKPHIMYSNKPQFVFSYNQADWTRMAEGSYDEEAKTYLVSQKFEKGPVWVAWAHPYTYTQSIAYMGKISQSPHVMMEKISSSVNDHGIFLYNISKNGSTSINKETIMAIALQHPGEDAGGYFIEGYTDYLLEASNSNKLLEKYNFLIIQVMNPDGVMDGNTRYNANMEDLNNIWNNPDLMQPEVKGVQEWLTQYTAQGHRITRFFDVHCWGQETENLYLTNNDTAFCDQLNKYVHFAAFPSTSNGGACQYMQNAYNAKSATIELSQKSNNSETLLTVDDYRDAGAAVLKALFEQ